MTTNRDIIRCVATSAVDNMQDTFDYVFAWGADTWYHWAQACIFMKEQFGKAVSSIALVCNDKDKLYDLREVDLLTAEQLETIRDDMPTLFDQELIDANPDQVCESQYTFSIRVERRFVGGKESLVTILVVGDEPGCQVEAAINIEAL